MPGQVYSFLLREAQARIRREILRNVKLSRGYPKLTADELDLMLNVTDELVEVFVKFVESKVPASDR